MRRLVLLSTILVSFTLVAATLTAFSPSVAESLIVETPEVGVPSSATPVILAATAQPTPIASPSQIDYSPDAPEDWQPVVLGIDFRIFRLPDPNNVFVARMDRSFENLILETSIAQGRLASGIETVNSMASRYEQAINHWGDPGVRGVTVGNRNHVVVAINGDYYNWTTGEPVGGVVHSGWYAKRFNDNGGRSGFVWNHNRSTFIGECVSHPFERQIISFTHSITYIHGVNVSRPADRIVLYTPQFDSNTRTNGSGAEVVVEMVRPTMILPWEARALGYVREIRLNQPPALIPFDYVVLSAGSEISNTLLSNLNLGDLIGFSQEIKHTSEDDCLTELPTQYSKPFASLGGDFIFLKDGVVRPYSHNGNATTRNPRTAVAYNADYIYFIVVDGRDNANSIGMSIGQLGQFALQMLQAEWGIAQDGGGSSTMVINGEVVNNTFCNIAICEYEYTVYLPLVVQIPDENAARASLEPSPQEAPALLERLVANGLMMISVEPAQESGTFLPGGTITTAITATLRLGPGSNYAAFASVPRNAVGVVAESLSGVNGVLAKGLFWWRVSFGGLTGWLVEDALQRPPTPLGPRQIPGEMD